MFFKLRNLIDDSYSRNFSFAFFMGLFCVILGSASTALFVASCVVLIFINDKISLKEIWQESFLLGKKMPIVFVFPAFYLFVVLTSLRGDNGLADAFFVAGSYWQFLFMVPATIGLYHLSKDINFAGLFSLGCRLGLLFVVPLSFVQIYFFNLRPEGIFSNSLVFAGLCVTAAGFAMIEWREDTDKSRAWGWAVFAAGIVAALLTFSRGMLIPIATIIAIAVFYRFKVNSSFKFGLKEIAVLCIGIGVIFTALFNTDNGQRILNQRVLAPLKMYQQGEQFDQSISQRVDMQLTGFYAFLQSPLTGYGIENVVEQSNNVSQEVLGRKTEYTYTHLHNDYLTHGVGGGILLLFLFILVIFSPIIMTWRLRKDKSEIGLFYFSLVLTGSYCTIALTNLIFRNDQLTTMFCVACIFIIVRRLQLLKGVENTRIPHIPTIINGIKPIDFEPKPRHALFEKTKL